MEIIIQKKKQSQLEYLQVGEAYPNSKVVTHALSFAPLSIKTISRLHSDLSSIFHSLNHPIHDDYIQITLSFLNLADTVQVLPQPLSSWPTIDHSLFLKIFLAVTSILSLWTK